MNIEIDVAQYGISPEGLGEVPYLKNRFCSHGSLLSREFPASLIENALFFRICVCPRSEREGICCYKLIAAGPFQFLLSLAQQE